MIDGLGSTGPTRIARADIVARGLGYGAAAGAVTAVLIVALIVSVTTAVDLIHGAPQDALQEFGSGVAYSILALGFGGLVGAVVGLVGGIVFALAAMSLIGYKYLVDLAGVAVPAGLLVVISGALEIAHLVNGSPRPDPVAVLVALAATAPAGALIARPVLYGKRVPPTNKAQ
jgi:hypothetical protein